MLERISLKLIGLLRALFAVTLFSAATARTYASEVKLSEHLPENSISGLRALLEAAMTEAESIQLRDLVERDFEGRKIVAKSAKNPQLRTNVTLRKEQDFERDDSEISDRLLYSLTLSKSLFHWGALEANRAKGNLNLEIEELKTFEAYRKLALDIRKKYLAILVAQKDADLGQRNLERAQARVELERERLKAGTASTIQVYNLEVALNSAELDLMKKKNTLADQIDLIARLSGVPSEEISSGLLSEIPRQAILNASEIASIEQLFDERLNQGLSVQTQAKSLEFSEKDLHISNQRLKPKIGLSVGLTQYEMDEIGRRRAEEIVYAGITIGWSLFDGRATRGNKISAMARIEHVKRQLESAKSTYEFNLQRTKKLLDLNARILERDEEALNQASNYLHDTKKDFETGRASPDDLEKVEIAFATQEVRTNRSRSEYHNALANISSLLGFDTFAQKFIDQRSQ
ncbi:TolC family protein [Candidatus Pelagisphaera phototrophica]|uniref:TolC family protein n=1 Tax=Candidatus Pelagisphaera phototrophica TaxID=2684113 RepID=UPI0019E5C4FA|nr:TolC family protein [Candidatus Pelagisphaera phototrophica]QXD31765.1 TolC family protein [Candidatus Pelagisphaera phototrophica]